YSGGVFGNSITLTAGTANVSIAGTIGPASDKLISSATITGNNIDIANIGGAGYAGILGTAVFSALGNLNLNGTIYNAKQQDYAGAAINITNAASSAFKSSSGTISFTGPVTLGGDTGIDTTNGGLTTGADISFSNTINGGHDLALDSGSDGSILISGQIGADGAYIEDFTINNTKTASLPTIYASSYTQNGGSVTLKDNAQASFSVGFTLAGGTFDQGGSNLNNMDMGSLLVSGGEFKEAPWNRDTLSGNLSIYNSFEVRDGATFTPDPAGMLVLVNLGSTQLVKINSSTDLGNLLIIDTSGAGNKVELQSAVIMRQLELGFNEKGYDLPGILDAQGYPITCSGDWYSTYQGSFIPGGNVVTFSNAVTAQTITSNNQGFYSVTLDNNSINLNALAGNPLNISGDLVINSGKTPTITTNGNNMVVAGTTNGVLGATTESLNVVAGTGDVTFSDSIGSNKALSTVNLSGDEITVADVITTGSQTYNGDTTFNGGLYSNVAGKITVSGDVTLGNTVTVNFLTNGAVGDDIIINGDVDDDVLNSTHILVHPGDFGNVEFNGDIGSGIGVNSLTIGDVDYSDTGTAVLNDVTAAIGINVYTTGLITLNGSLISNGHAGGVISLAGNVTLNVPNTTIQTDDGGIRFRQAI
ncbi:MAG TPA: hypothetical protein PLV52_05450, partial [Candidatus Omnitrophota bacterium]|nr:hypothetical protein [Candidatus Omnitrophota bacterium]